MLRHGLFPPGLAIPHPSVPRRYKDPTVAVAHSVLFNLPAEIRNKIYSYVMATRNKIFVSQYGGDRLYIRHCGQALDDDDDSDAVSNYEIRKHEGCTRLDTALSFTCREVQDEFLQYLFTHHDLVLSRGDRLDSLSAGFGTYLRNVHVLCLQNLCIADKKLEEHELQSLRKFAVAFANLKSIQVCADVRAEYAQDDEVPFHAEAVLNWFKPLSRLNVARAEVVFSVSRRFVDEQIGEGVIQDLETRAVGVLLKDPSLPEEAQILRPKEHFAAKQKHDEESEKAWRAKEARYRRGVIAIGDYVQETGRKHYTYGYRGSETHTEHDGWPAKRRRVSL